ncbi:FMN-dependent NADH-azoreductase [Flavobacterium sp. RHBU_24]|uniref:FMN-dependent NADH-azoreductase n=1 Tax=Flavobacterium sp. RHBU_24 TaxID=3391185 RepID=UPI0039853C8F
MKNILHIISSPRGEASVSVQLGNTIAQRVTETFPGSTVTQLDLSVNPFPHIDGAYITALFTPPELATPEVKAALKRSDEAVVQLLESDILVIGLPLYNLGVSSTLKSWIDNVVRAGQTFRYKDGVPDGLAKGKKAYIAVASGSVFSEGPMAAFDYAVTYLTGVLNFIGITDINVVRAEGLAIPGLQARALEKAIEAIDIV